MEQNEQKDITNLIVKNDIEKQESLTQKKTLKPKIKSSGSCLFFNRNKKDIPSNITQRTFNKTNANYFNSTLRRNNSSIFQQEDLLVVIGCKSNQNIKTLNKTKSPKIFRRFIKKKTNSNISKVVQSNQFTQMRRNNQKEYIPIQKQQRNIMPFQIAGTIYAELTRQKSEFFKKLKLRNRSLPNILNKVNAINKSKYKHKIPLSENHCYTNLLNRNVINDIPLTMPIYLTHNQHYNSISEKMRHEKIVNAIIKLKTIISKDPDNDLACIKEFMLKNGIVDREYYEIEKLNNFCEYLKKPIDLNPKKTLYEIITDAVYYQPSEEELRKKMQKETKIDNDKFFIYPNKENINTHHIKKRYVNKKKEVDRDMTIDEEKFYEKINLKYEQDDLNELIKKLQEEFVTLKKEKMDKIERTNNIGNPEIKVEEEEYDKNRYVPNLCLCSFGINSVFWKNINNKKKKIQREINKQKKIKELNQRLYYSSVLGNNELDIEEIKRRNKLTEFIMLERAKNKLALEKQKEKFDIKKQTKKKIEG